MTGSAYPSLLDLLPHRPPMILLTRIITHEAMRTICAVDITESAAFLTGERVVPSWVGIEYMAQCVAAHAGLVGRTRGEEVRLGLLIGARRVDLHTEGFPVGQSVIVTAVHIWGDQDLASFTCALSDASTGLSLADATLSVYSPPNAAAMLTVR